MTSPVRQDLAPKGGFPSFSHVRHIPKKGFSGLTMLGMCTAVVLGGVGAYASSIYTENAHRRARQQERMEFLEKLERHQRKKHLSYVWEQAFRDALYIDAAIIKDKKGQ